MNLKKTALSAAVVASLSGAMIAPAQAVVLDFDFLGNFTLLDSGNNFVANSDASAAEVAAYNGGAGTSTYYEAYKYFGNRTPISGTLQFDTATGAGSGTVNPFLFFGSGNAVAKNITMQAIGDGAGGKGSLILGSMLFDWAGNNNIVVNIVLDGAGLFAALPTMAPGDTINQTTCAVAGSGCAVAGSDGVVAGTGKNAATYPQGAIPVATTTFNVMNDGSAIGGGTYANSDGTTTTYTSNDAIAGTFMDNGPFIGFNASFDMTSLTMAAVPVPAAVWLFGSGLIGLAGVARRRKA